MSYCPKCLSKEVRPSNYYAWECPDCGWKGNEDELVPGEPDAEPVEEPRP